MPPDGEFGIKVVMIGGGTGSFTLLSVFKNYFQNLTAVVNMVDNGGSTGVLRDELGVLPPGDIRQCLVALATDPGVMRELFNYRFPSGTFEGHAFGNMFLSALEKVTGSFADAVKEAGRVLAIRGQVLPMTLDDVQLFLQPATGPTVKGEQLVEAEVGRKAAGHSYPKLFLDPPPAINPEVAAAIADANVIVVAPGDIFTSIVPNFLVPGLGEAVRQSRAMKIYVCNLVTEHGITDGYEVQDFVRAIEHYAGGRVFDHVLYNNAQPPKDVLQRYHDEGTELVKYDRDKLANLPAKYVGEDFLSKAVPTGNPHDTLIKRNYIRHDADKVARMVMRLAI